MDIVKVEENGDNAKVYWKSNKSEGVNQMVKENGKWMMLADID